MRRWDNFEPIYWQQNLLILTRHGNIFQLLVAYQNWIFLRQWNHFPALYVAAKTVTFVEISRLIQLWYFGQTLGQFLATKLDLVLMKPGEPQHNLCGFSMISVATYLQFAET